MKKYLIAAAVLLPLVSCQREAYDLPPEQAKGTVTFSASLSGSLTKSDAVWSVVPQEDVQTTSSGDTLWIRSSVSPFPVQSAATKAAPYTGGSDSATPGKVTLPTEVSFALMAYTYNASQATMADASTWTSYVPSPGYVRTTYDGLPRSGASGKWVPDSRIIWPGGGYVRYFAFAPYEAAAVDGASVSIVDATRPSITYKVPASYADQKDLLVSKESASREYEGDPPVTLIDVPMDFEHALTAVRFRLGEGLSVSSISISGVYDTGTLTLGDASPSWAPNTSSKSTYTITAPTLITDPSDNAYKTLSPEYTLLLMPQTIPAGARITATVTDGTESRTVNAFMEGAQWTPGTMVVYTITTLSVDLVLQVLDENGNALSEISLTADESVSDVLQNVSVTSYRNSSLSGVSNLPWTVSYSTDGGSTFSSTPPAWMGFKDASGASLSTGGTGSQSGEKRSVYLAANLSENDRPTVSVNVGEDRIGMLRRAPEVESPASPRDLSLYNIYGEPYSSQTSIPSITASGHHTANTYIVSAPGYYCFPLVFGNAIDATRGDGSAVNSVAYGSSLTNDGIPWFADSKGAQITSPYVLSSAADLSRYDAVAVWQDVSKDYQVIFDADIEVVSAASVGSSLSCPYIRFKLARGPETKETLTGRDGYPKGPGILPCNILIALRDKNQQDPYDASKPRILWSWHIWVTPTPHEYARGGANDDFALRTVKYRKLQDYSATNLPEVTFLNCPLGWTPPIYYYAGGNLLARSTVVRFTQEGGRTLDFPVGQRAGTLNPDDGGSVYGATYYEWGRKDPFLPGKSLSPTANRTCYSESGYKITTSERNTIPNETFSTSKTNLESSLPYVVHKHPGTSYFFGRNLYPYISSPFTGAYWWNINGSAHTLSSVRKTVYDPSPAGFCVPFSQAFTGFYSAQVFRRENYENIYFLYPVSQHTDLSSTGLYCTSDGTDSGPKDFHFPRLGWRSNNGGILSFENSAAGVRLLQGYWTSSLDDVKPTDSVASYQLYPSGDSFTLVDFNVLNAQHVYVTPTMFSLSNESVYLQFNLPTRGNPVRPILEDVNASSTEGYDNGGNDDWFD